MTEAIALYHPFIHFRDEEWLKSAALYWPKMTRIVPPDFELRDSDVVKRLRDELEFVRNVTPVKASSEVAPLFGTFLAEHESSLRDRYGVDKADDWKPDPITRQREGLSDADTSIEARLAHIYASKFPPGLLNQLFQAGLAVHARRDWEWIGVHPKLAEVYMAALTEQVAHDEHLQPVTDGALSHVAVSGWTMDRLAEALLDEPGLARRPRPDEETSALLAFVAIGAVRPKGDNVDVEKIIRIRKRYERERGAFADEVERLATALNESLASVEDVGALEAHLGAAYDATLGQQLSDLKMMIHDVGLDAAFGVMDVKLVVPPALASAAAIGGITLNPVVALGGAVAIGFGKLTRSLHRRTAAVLRDSPAAYLLRIDRELPPKSLLQRIGARFSRFIRDV
jgi:hypothetical protein